MAKLLYSAIASLDAHIEDAQGRFDWAMPDEELHAFVNDLERPIGTCLYGRRMYETMRYWETADREEGQSPVALDYARIWQASEKVVFSTTLGEGDVSTAKTRLERRFDAPAVRELKQSADSDISVGGPGLAAEALRAGLVDEVSLFLHPVAVGSGKKVLPGDLRIDLELLEQRRFESGVIYVRYAVSP